MAIKFDFSDPKNQRIIASFMVPVVFVALFYNFMIKPKINVLNSKKAEVVTLQRRVNDIKKKVGNPEILREEKETLQARYNEMEKLLPSEENVSYLLDQFNEVENESKVYIVGFEATQAVLDESKPYSENKYRITIESGFHQFARFMSDIMSLPRIMSISELEIAPNPLLEQNAVVQEGLEDQPRTLRIECTITSYVFKNTESGS